MTYCCEHMAEKINHKCSTHTDPFECPDHLICYDEEYEEFGIMIHDGGHSYVAIDFCPWCGSPL